MKYNIFKLLIIIPLVAISCKGNKGIKQVGEQVIKEDTIKMEKTLAFNPAELPAEPIFDINTTVGIIRIKLYKETPHHRANFIKLASERFYDNILFHRVINGFMIQTGDPLTKDTSKVASYGTGGPGYTIPSEILPQFKHKKGALAAARRGDPGNPMKESSGSQFYIVQDAATCAQLDGDYTIFGETIKGFEVIDLIAVTPTNRMDLPLAPIKIISITPVINTTPVK